MSRLVGIPDVAAASDAPLTATLIWTHEYRRGDRFAAGRVDLTYDRAAGEWREGGAVFDLLAARFGQSDPAPPNIRVLFTLAGTQGTSLTFVPIESAAGTVDLTKPLNVAQWVVGAEYASLQVQQQNAIAALNEFSAAGGAVAQDIAENLGLLGGVLADIEQSAANLNTASVPNVAALAGKPAAAYRVVDTGQTVWWSGAAITQTGPTAATAATVAAAQASADTANTRIQTRAAPNAADTPGTTAASLTTALTAMLSAGARRLDIPVATYAVAQSVVVDHDLHLYGAGGADWLNSAPVGSVFQATGGVSNIFKIIGYPYVNPATQEVFPAARIGAYSWQGLTFQGEGGPGGRITNAAHRYELGNGPVRPVKYDDVTFRGFQNAIDVVVAPGANTGIGQITFNNVTFTDCDKAIRSRGNNGILQALFNNVTMEQGGRIDVEQGDVPGEGPGAMGAWIFNGGQFEGQSNAIKIYGGSWQFFMRGTYFEHNTGRTLDLRASSRNSSAEILQLHVETDPINVYVQGFGRCEVRTAPEKINLYIGVNGPRSNYGGMNVRALLDPQGTMVTACDPGGTLAHTSPFFPGLQASALVVVPSAVRAGRTPTPWGILNTENVSPGPLHLRPVPFAVTAGQMAVACTPVRWISGLKTIGYGIFDNADSGLDSRNDALELDDQGWTLLTICHRFAGAAPTWKFALAADGLIEVGDAWVYLLPDDTTPLRQWIPRQITPERTGGVAIIPAGVGAIAVSHGLPARPSYVLLTSGSAAKVWDGGVRDTDFSIVTDATDITSVNWEAVP